MYDLISLVKLKLTWNTTQDVSLTWEKVSTITETDLVTDILLKL